jgi:hypothetical protein
MALFEAISQAIACEEAVQTDALFSKVTYDLSAADRTSKKASLTYATPNTKPILQLIALPLTINPDDYTNPCSTANPDGSLASLWAFRQLVDPVPMFSRYYSPSGNSTEDQYSLIINGASIKNDNPFASEVISQSQRKLSLISYANMDKTPGTWAPVYATPDDWYETAGDRYKTLEFDLNQAGAPDSPFAVIGDNNNPLGLKISSNCSPDVTTPLDTNSRVNKITLKYLQVTLHRPWFNELLFNTSGWYLSCQPAGFCSSGSLQANEGILPLLPTSILFATDVTVDAKWSSGDQRAIDAALTKGQQVSLNHLVIYSTESQAHLQPMGWIMSLVPFSPKSP